MNNQKLKRVISTLLSIVLLLSFTTIMVSSESVSDAFYYEAVSDISADTPYIISMPGIAPTGQSTGNYAMLNSEVNNEPTVRNFSAFNKSGTAKVSNDFLWTFESFDTGYALRASSIEDDSVAYLNITESGFLMGERQQLTISQTDGKFTISKDFGGNAYFIRFSNSGGSSSTSGFYPGTKAISHMFEIYQMKGFSITPLPDTDEEPLFTIAAISDLHADYGIQNEDTPIRPGVIKACEEIRKNENANILLIGGDITSDNVKLGWSKEQYDKAMAEVYSAAESATESGRAMYVTGNHDFVAGGADWNSGDYLDDMLGSIGDYEDILWQNNDVITQNGVRHALAIHYIVDGLDFILLNTPYTGLENHGSYEYSGEMIPWIDNKLAEIGSDKTVVVMGHYPFRDSNNLSYPGKGMTENSNTAFKNTFKNYPNLIYLYGHDHGGSYVNNDTFEKITPYSDTGTPINARVTSNDSFISAFMGSMSYYTGGLSKEQPKVVQALIVKIYSDRITFAIKNYGENTGDSALPTEYSIAKEVKLSLPPVEKGDLNKDNQITVTDIVKLRSIIMDGKWNDEELAIGDLNNDNNLTVTDIVSLRAKIMN